MCLNQGLGTMVWSPLGWGRLTGKMRRGLTAKDGRIKGGAVGGPEVDDEYLYDVVDERAKVSAELDPSIPQVALAWVLSRPSISTVVKGARNSEQLASNIAAAELKLSDEYIARLDKVSHRTPIYPYWHQRDFDDRNPKPTQW